MTVQLIGRDIGALESLPARLAGSHFHPPPLIVERLDGKLPSITVVAALSEQDSGIQKLLLWKGNLPHRVFKALLIIAPLYNFWGDIFLEFILRLFWPFSWLLCPVSWQGKMSVIVFGELDGWRTYWHVYCRTQPSAMPPQLPPLYPVFYLFLGFSFSSKMEETTAIVVGFYPAFSTSSSSFISIHLSSILFFSLSPPPLPIHPSMPRVQSALLFPVLWLQRSLQQCHKRTCSHKGRKNVCVTNNAASMHRILI